MNATNLVKTPRAYKAHPSFERGELPKVGMTNISGAKPPLGTKLK
nr:MAG TPA: hypothetical protein [Bacteriophage sp.]